MQIQELKVTTGVGLDELCHVIPNPLNLQQWSPVEPRLARRLLDLPLQAPLILFGAMGGTEDPREWASMSSAPKPVSGQASECSAGLLVRQWRLRHWVSLGCKRRQIADRSKGEPTQTPGPEAAPEVAWNRLVQPKASPLFSNPS